MSALYNTVLCVHSLLEHTDVTVMLDILGSSIDLGPPIYQGLDELLRPHPRIARAPRQTLKWSKVSEDSSNFDDSVCVLIVMT